MRRREFIALVGGLALANPPLASAQNAKIHRLGTLIPGAPMTPSSEYGGFLFPALAQRGYRLGENLALEARGAAGNIGMITQLAGDLKAAGVEVVLTVGYPAAAAAKASGLPTVLAWGSGDPVKTGLVDGLAKPGGNVTGIADDAARLSTKRLSLLKQMIPRLKKVAMLWNRNDLGMSQRYDASARAAEADGVVVQALGVRAPDDFKEAFDAMTSNPPDAILMVSDALTNLNRKRVVDFAAEHRLPAIYEAESIVREGGLMSYSADLAESFDRAAALVDRIFKGAKPADLPVEEPARYRLVLNLKTANAIGLEIPPTLSALADQVIE